MNDQEIVVLDHHHDSENNIYRLQLGTPVEVERMVTDENGDPVPSQVPLIGPDGEPVSDVDGKPVVLFGPPQFERVIEHTPAEDFVFASDDKRWKGKTPEEIAELQRKEVKKELAKRKREATKTTKARNQLPGSGEAL